MSRAEDIRNVPILSRQGSKKENIDERKIVHILMAYDIFFLFEVRKCLKAIKSSVSLYQT